MNYLIGSPTKSIKDIFLCINQYVYVQSTLNSTDGRNIINIDKNSKKVMEDIDNNYIIGFVRYDNCSSNEYLLYRTVTVEQAKELYNIL